MPSESRSDGRKLAAVATERVQRETTPQALQTYGMPHLTCAWTDALAGQPGDAQTHLDEAAAVADRLGDDPAQGGFAEMNFGPTNAARWREICFLELHRAARDARPSASRRSGHPRQGWRRVRRQARGRPACRGRNARRRRMNVHSINAKRSNIDRCARVRHSVTLFIYALLKMN